MTNTIIVFCANEQKETEHTLDIDGAGEIVLTCGCGRFLKFPKDTSPDQLKEYVASQKEDNQGQISVESIESAKAKLAEAFADADQA